jgi:hypothetical protein
MKTPKPHRTVVAAWTVRAQELAGAWVRHRGRWRFLDRGRCHAGYYAAFVIDPDGNNVEAVFHGDRQLPAT